MSKTKTITGQGSGGETYTVTYTGADNLNISERTFNIATLFPTVTAKISGMVTVFGTPNAWVETDLTFNTNSRRYYMPNKWEENIPWDNNATKTIPINDLYSTTEDLNTSSFFNSSNPTSRTVPITYELAHTMGDYSAVGGAGGGIWRYSGTSLSLGQTITLDAPPSCSYTDLTKDTDAYYSNVTFVSTTISDASAQYGGDISEIKLTIGDKSATRTTNGVISLTVGSSGTYTPVISIKDSREQITSYNLDPITIVESTPTTFNYTQVESSTNGFYAGISTATITISDCSVPYGGSIVQTKLTIGQQTVTGTGNGALSINLNTVGSFNPVLSVLDSFGRSYVVNLNSINVLSYVAPSLVLSVERVKSQAQSDYSYIGEVDDDGLSCVITTSIQWINEVASILAPTIAVNGPNGETITTNVTWYKNREESGSTIGKLKDQISNWSSITPNDMPIYGFVDNSSHTTFNTNFSYKITITPRDEFTSGNAISQTIAQAFHTIDFLAGGHGVSMGRPASREEKFDCDLQIATRDKSNIFREIFDIMHPVGSWYSTSLRPKMTSGETGANMVDYFDPSEAWGGTWELLDEGIVLTSAGANHIVSNGTSKDGGNDTISYTPAGSLEISETTLTIDQIPAHTHGSKTLTGSFSIADNVVKNTATGAFSAATGIAKASSIQHNVCTTGTSVQNVSVNDKITITATHEHTSVGSNDSHTHSNSTFTGTQANINVEQPYKNAYWWHRIS